GRRGADRVGHAARPGIPLTQVGGVDLGVVAEAQQVVAQHPLEVGPRLFAFVSTVVDAQVVGATQRHARVGHAAAGADVVAVHVVRGAAHAGALGAAVHQFHRQVVGEIRGPGQRPVVAAAFGVRIAERLADLVVLEVVGVGGGIHPVLVGEAHQAQQVVVGDLPVQGGAPETVVGL